MISDLTYGQLKQEHEEGKEFIFEAPQYFDDFQTPEIPTDVLPGVFCDFASALSEATETPPGLAVMTVLGVISACTAKYYTVSPKAGWHEPTNIYAMISMEPGTNKSYIFKQSTSPMIEWEREQRKRLEPSLIRQASERQTLIDDVKHLRKTAVRAKDKAEKSKMQQEIADLEISIPEVAVLPQLFTNDATPESLAQNIAEQHGRFAILSDEGGIIETLSGLYSNGIANTDILLKGIDGGAVRIDRKDAKCIMVNPYLTILLAIQPAIINTMASKKSFTGKGFLERFLYLVPKTRLGYRTHNNEPVSESLKAEYSRAIHELLDRHPHEANIQSTQLDLSQDAKDVWRKWQHDNELEMRPDGRYQNMTGWAGKICGMTLRLAGLIHIASNEQGSTISSGTMKSALTLSALLCDHAVAAYSSLSIDKETATAQKLVKWLRQKSEGEFTQSEFTHYLRHEKLTEEQKEKVLGILIQRQIISEPLYRDGSHRKPVKYYEINPALKD